MAISSNFGDLLPKGVRWKELNGSTTNPTANMATTCNQKFNTNILETYFNTRTTKGGQNDLFDMVEVGILQSSVVLVLNLMGPICLEIFINLFSSQIISNKFIPLLQL